MINASHSASTFITSQTRVNSSAVRTALGGLSDTAADGSASMPGTPGRPFDRDGGDKTLSKFEAERMQRRLVEITNQLSASQIQIQLGMKKRHCSLWNQLDVRHADLVIRMCPSCI